MIPSGFALGRWVWCEPGPCCQGHQGSGLACTLPLLPACLLFRPPSNIVCLLQVRGPNLRLSKREMLGLSSSQWIPGPHFQEIIQSIHTFTEQSAVICWEQMTRTRLPSSGMASWPVLKRSHRFSSLQFYPSWELFLLRKYLCAQAVLPDEHLAPGRGLGHAPPFSCLN